MSDPVIIPIGDTLTFTAFGQPAPQGSKRHVGKGVMVEASKHTKPWREAVKSAALEAFRNRQPMDGPLAVKIDFTFNRPRAHYRLGKNAHVLRDDAPFMPASKATPDIDKLVRACLDACTDAGVWHDDSQVSALAARKLYVNELGGLHIPGVRISVGLA